MQEAKREVLAAAVDALKAAPNVVAIVLGGSYARGLDKPGSDIDIGIYYREAAPLPIERIREIAASLSAPGTTPVVTDLYGWGPWVNGGAWIQTPAAKVDFVYRNLDQVRAVIEEGQRGIWRHDYDQQPPFGFRSIVYFAETHYCRPLHDPEDEILTLKQAVSKYPPPLQHRILHESLWGAEFSLWSGGQYAAAGDVLNTAGCLTRAAHFIVHALFALNETYFLNDKQVNVLLPQFRKCPRDCALRLADLLSTPGRSDAELLESVVALRQLWMESVQLTEGAYQPRFDLAAATP